MYRKWFMLYNSADMSPQKTLFCPFQRKEHIKLSWWTWKILLQLLLQIAFQGWDNRIIRKFFSSLMSILLFPWHKSQSQVEQRKEDGWQMSYPSHSISLVCTFVPNVINAGERMSLRNVCLANWSKDYSLWSPNEIRALTTAGLEALASVKLLGRSSGLSEFRHAGNGNCGALGVEHRQMKFGSEM